MYGKMEEKELVITRIKKVSEYILFRLIEFEFIIYFFATEEENLLTKGQ